jgi:hypothetical protein
VSVGKQLGNLVGVFEGMCEGSGVDGRYVGSIDGVWEGISKDGINDGIFVGKETLGVSVGKLLGNLVGVFEGM